MNGRETGFSVLELLVVVAIGLVVTAIAIPSIRDAMASYQLDTGGRVVASMLQSGKMAAVTANQPYYAQYNVPSPQLASASPPPAVRAYVTADPTAAISSSVGFQAAANLPVHLQLDAYLGGGNAANVSIQLGTPIGFNARGMPCIDPAGLFTFGCVQLDPAAGNKPVAFEWFMQHNATQGWEAVTVSPAGQIRSWRMSSAGTWQ
jgi:Tfp pilus assembly protein PilE